ncbi:MAG: hypothetical protein ACO3VI_06035 [Ilumatobacteraceae bacterium]
MTKSTDNTGPDCCPVDGGVAQAFETFPGFWTLLGRGISRRCPWCGDRRAYFVGWFKRIERCQRCRHAWRRGDAAFELGATTANIILTFLSVLLAMLIAVLVTLPDIPFLPLIIIVGVLAVLGPAIWYPTSFTLWQAVDLFMRKPDADEMAGRRDAEL